MTQENIPFIKYESIKEITGARELKHLNEQEFQIFEKIDGGLCQVRKYGGRLLPGCKANFLSGPIVDKIGWFGKFVGWTYQNHTLYNISKHIILFGEWGGHHTIQYDSKNRDKFYLIDVFDFKKHRFLDYALGRKMTEDLGIQGLEFVKPLFIGKIEKNTLNILLSQPSAYYSGPKEGLVIKDYNSNPQQFFKILNPGFEELRKRLFGRIDPFTNARFKKNVQKAIEASGGNASLEMLVRVIREDIAKETGKDYQLDYVKKKLDDYISYQKANPKL